MAEPTPTTNEVKLIGKTPVSIRAKEEYRDFLNSLIQEKNFSPAQAIEHCIMIAKNGPPAPAPSKATEEIRKLQEEVDTLLKQLKQKPVPAPVPAPAAAPYVQRHHEFLSKISTKKNIDVNGAIDYCIVYTKRNDWL